MGLNDFSFMVGGKQNNFLVFDYFLVMMKYGTPLKFYGRTTTMALFLKLALKFAKYIWDAANGVQSGSGFSLGKLGSCLRCSLSPVLSLGCCRGCGQQAGDTRKWISG